MTRYLVYDVFTDIPFGGNPLAIIPDAGGLSESRLQLVAREFNFSETVFILPPESDSATARLRIFTPTQEIPFAGHPTVGAAVALNDLGGPRQMVFDMEAGPVICLADAGRAAFTVETPLSILHRPDPTLIARCLGLPADAIGIEAHMPVIASVGLPFVLVELDGSRSLDRAAPQIEAFREAARRYPLPFDFAIYAYLRDGSRIDARMFAPLDEIPEDPATGSAAAALGAFLADHHAAPQSFTVHQGVAMGRASRIGVEADGTGVTISGQAVRVMSGTLHLS